MLTQCLQLQLLDNFIKALEQMIFSLHCFFMIIIVTTHQDYMELHLRALPIKVGKRTAITPSIFI